MRTYIHILDCVTSPRRSDKPHRQLTLTVTYESESPHLLSLSCMDGEVEVLTAEIDTADLESIVQMSRHAQTELKKEW